MKFRKKPIVIEAFRYGFDTYPEWFSNAVDNNDVIIGFNECSIHTLEGWMVGEKGNYIIKGIKDEIYPCKQDIFESSYERVE